ncbi:MAG: hypothetical protein ACI96P_000021, partial [Candidatus Azotimanducaceae bacterium]
MALSLVFRKSVALGQLHNCHFVINVVLKTRAVSQQ